MFGQSNTSGGFGGFGANNNANTTGNTGSVFGSGGGFGQPAASTAPGFGGGGFGSTTAGTSGAFGAAQQQQPSAGFGGGGGFGSNNSAFGAAKPAFGSGPTGGGLFGASNSTAPANTSGGFGFGGTSASSGFGASNTNTGGGMFGASKPAFGAAATSAPASGGLFGTTGTSSGTGGFGSGSTGGGIGFGGAAATQLPLQGTATTPYTPFSEKEPSSTTMSHYQVISFMPAYKNFSLEELRLQDYNQGRRYGNESSGQSGAFGFSGFGSSNNGTGQAGFGTANTTGAASAGLFGNNNNNQTGGFGSTGAFSGASNTSAGGGLFGAKPATTGGGLFGSGNTGTGTTGGLFGPTNTNTGGAFGGAGTGGFGSTSTGGGFGAANQNQNKGFSFGGTGTTGTTGGFGPTGAGTGAGFGAQQATGTGGGLFGPAQAGGFGTQSGGAGFGGGAPAGFGTNPQQSPAPFGSGGFGTQQQQKPGFGTGNAVFGSAPAATTGGGLFGNTQQNQQQQPGSLFGKNAFGGTAPSTTPAPGGLFGSSNQAQQQPSGGLFGGAQPSTSTGGGLFPGQTATNQSSSLFGPNQNRPAGGLFGSNPTPQAQGGGLFSGSTAPSSMGGLFPGQQQQQPPQGGGAFGGSFGGAQQNPQQQQFTTSITDSPYGNSLLSSVGSQNQSLGPIAMPIGSSQTKKAAMIPHHKIAPRQPALTPRLGSSYSKSGSPFAASSNANNGLVRAISNSKLNLFDSDDSILNAGAFTPNGGSRVSSLKKLVIDKKIRDQDLFSEGAETRGRDGINSRGSTTKSILKKTVSFDMGTDSRIENQLLAVSDAGESSAGPSSGPAPSAEELGFIRTTPDKRRSRDADESPKMALSGQLNGQSAVGNELAVVQQPKEDTNYGTYWMVPNAHKLKSYTREQQKKVLGLTIGRRGFGSVRFDNPVDITGLPCDLEDIPGVIVQLEARVCTVYPEGMDKPVPGKGLNVPATIQLEDCFPVSKNERGKITDPEHPRYINHIRRLRSIKDTEFLDYHPQNGVWIFKVRHFTTYGLVESDDEGEVVYDESFVSEDLAPQQSPGTFAPFMNDDSYNLDADLSGLDSISGLDDTFDFKRLGSSAIGLPPAVDQLPGSFLGLDGPDLAYESTIVNQGAEGEEANFSLNGESFLGDGSVGSVEEEDEPAEPVSDDEAVGESTMIVARREDEMEEDAAGVVDDVPARLFQTEQVYPVETTEATPKALPLGRDWTEQLNNTISPVKRRFGGENLLSAQRQLGSPAKAPTMRPLNYGLLDLATDLYGSPSKLNGSVRQDSGRTRKRDQFEPPASISPRSEGARPLTKKPTTSFVHSGEHLDFHSLDGHEQAWRKAVRPTWGHNGIMIHMDGSAARKETSALSVAKVVLGTELHAVPKTLQLQLRATNITLDDFGVPFADADPGVLFQSFAELPWLDEAGEQHEKSVWRLASVLWDPVSDLPAYQDASLELQSYVHEKRRKELLSQLLQELVEKEADHHVQSASTPEEVAFAHLTAHRIEQACAVLLDGGDIRLATLLPMLGGDMHTRHRMGKQLGHWRNKGVLSEISIPVRALYELLAGETCYSDGVKGPLEDASPGFYLAEHFGLDWKRVLALKFWYGCFEDEGICAVVEKYEGDVEHHPGKVSIPQPWYLGPGDKRGGAMDLLWGLLKLYSDDLLGLDEVLNPTNLGSSNTDYRLPWQLRTILAKRGVRDFPGGELAEDGFSFLAGAHADRITSDFAGSLENAGLWEWAIFVMMHVRSSDSRASAIKTIIARHVDDIEDGDKSAFLEKTLSIPRVWIYEAKALQARYANEHLLEAEYLISAKAWNEAHKTIVQQVAPEAIIVGDLEDLRKILGKFEHLEQIQGWGLGGQVYQDYIRLLGIIRMGPSPKNKEAQREVTKRLLGALKNMERTGPMQNIAVREMAGVVGSWILKTGDMASEKPKVLELPLTEDQYLRKTVNLSLEYYKAKLQAVH